MTEAVLADFEERQAAAPESAPWPGAPELNRAQQKLNMLTRQWQEDRTSNGLYFSNVEKLEARIRELTNDRNSHAAVAQRAVADVRRRWFTPPEDGGWELPEKHAYVREALYAVIVSPRLEASVATASSTLTSSNSSGVLDHQSTPTVWDRPRPAAEDTVEQSGGEDVQRRQMLHALAAGAATAGSSAFGWFGAQQQSAPAARAVGLADVQIIREMTQTFRRLDNRFGGGRAGSAVTN